MLYKFSPFDVIFRKVYRLGYVLNVIHRTEKNNCKSFPSFIYSLSSCSFPMQTPHLFRKLTPHDALYFQPVLLCSEIETTRVGNITSYIYQTKYRTTNTNNPKCSPVCPWSEPQGYFLYSVRILREGPLSRLDHFGSEPPSL